VISKKKVTTKIIKLAELELPQILQLIGYYDLITAFSDFHIAYKTMYTISATFFFCIERRFLKLNLIL